MRQSISEIEKILSELKDTYNQIIDDVLNNPQTAKELYGYPPDFEKKNKGKPVDLEKLHQILIELKII